MESGNIPRETFRKKMQKHQIMVAKYLDEASQCGDLRTMCLAKRILKLEPALWTFVEREGVEPTNNYAERLIRPAVIWRKVSFGTDSAKGSRFVERMLTAVTTLRLQSRNVLAFLKDMLVKSHNVTSSTSDLADEESKHRMHEHSAEWCAERSCRKRATTLGLYGLRTKGLAVRIRFCYVKALRNKCSGVRCAFASDARQIHTQA
ncbi:hypothetical protein Q3G72_020774 [Acer saccharum]|nr:hypothetical protein Q3G72_020774 [Acer saccharum]